MEISVRLSDQSTGHSVLEISNDSPQQLRQHKTLNDPRTQLLLGYKFTSKNGNTALSFQFSYLKAIPPVYMKKGYWKITVNQHNGTFFLFNPARQTKMNFNFFIGLILILNFKMNSSDKYYSPDSCKYLYTRKLTSSLLILIFMPA